MLGYRSIKYLALAALLFALALPAPARAAEAVVSGPVGEKVDRFMSRLEGFGFAGSLLVAKDGKVIVHKGYGLADREKKVPWTAETGFDIGSITKQFTAAAILKLEMEGKLKVTDPIGKYFGEVPADKAGITIHHLLTHSSGLEGDFGGDYEEATRDGVVLKALGSKLLWAPGTRYQYSNAGYSLLGAIVEIVSGQPYETFLQEKIWKPAGLARTGYKAPKWAPGSLAHGYRGALDTGTPLDQIWGPDGPWWNLRANGGVLSTTGDLFKWHQALEGEVVLSKAAKEKYFTPHMPEDEEGSSHYGYGWAVMKTPRGTRLISHNGGNGIFAADFRRYVDEGVAILIGSNQSDFSSIPVSNQVARILFGMEYVEPPAVVKVDPKTLERYAGTYTLLSGGRFTVTAAPADFAGRPRLSIAPEGGDALGLLAGGGAQAAPGNEEMGKRVVAALEKSLTGDYAPLAAVYGVPLAQAEAETKRDRARLEERHGAFKSFELLGTAAAGGRTVTFVRFHFERGSTLAEYGWDGQAVSNIRILDSLPGGTFVPVGSGELASFDPRSRTVTLVGFEAAGDAAATALVVRAPGGDVKAERFK